MVTKVAVCGPPLAGKTSFVRAVAGECKAPLLFGRLVTSAGRTQGWTFPVAYAEVERNGFSFQLTCAPGGSSEDSVADIANGATFGIFVFDPQPGRDDQQRDFWNAALATGLRWFPIVNKRDLVPGPPDELLHRFGLDGVPHRHTSFLRGAKEEAIRSFDAAVAYARSVWGSIDRPRTP